MENEITTCLNVLNNGGTILYPTDTIWGIGCDATNTAAVEAVYNLKQRPENKSMIILLGDERQLNQYVSIVPVIARDLMKNVSTPLTIVYPGAKNLSDMVIADDGSVAIRIVKQGFCHHLLKAFGKPLVSTSANISGEPAPQSYRQISRSIKSGVDHAVSERFHEPGNVKPSQIIKINNNGEFRVIRK